MVDMNGQRIAGYRFGPYWLQAGGRGDRISGLSGSSFATEGELLDAYDSANGEDRVDGQAGVRNQAP